MSGRASPLAAGFDLISFHSTFSNKFNVGLKAPYAQSRYTTLNLMQKEQHICPVCGYSDLEEPPYNEYGEPTYVICSCCGFEFGFHDSSEGYTFEQYRQEWIKNGFKFFSKAQPANWSKRTMLAQLENAKSTSWQPRL